MVNTIKWTQAEAIELCKHIEAFAPEYGFHVALTGGCLYKEGDRADLDLVFYRDRRVVRDTPGLFRKLYFQLFAEVIGWNDGLQYGWRCVVKISGRKVDMLFPQWNDDFDK